MKGRVLAGFCLSSLFLVVGGDAQSPNIPEKPVWTLEFIKVEPEKALAMRYLDDHWMRVRAEAKRQGAVLDYHIISNVTPGHKVWDKDSIVLVTKYKSMDAYLESTSAASIRYLVRDSQGLVVPQGNVRFLRAGDLFEALNTQVFIEEPDTSPELKLPTKQ